MNTSKQVLIEAVQAVCVELGYPEVSFVIERPADMQHGDWACNVALLLAKHVGKKPRDIAETIAGALRARSLPHIASIEIAGAGFINVRCTPAYFKEALARTLANTTDMTNPAFAGKTVMVEYTQPNPFKPFHIGHLMSNTIGETIARAYADAGATVIRANYQGDVGLHVAKALWGMMQKNVDPSDIAGIGTAYAYGHEQYETNETAKAEIIALNKKVYARDESIMDTYTAGRTETLQAFEKIYALLGTTFDEYFFESEVWEQGMTLVHEGVEKGIFEKSDGAIVFPGEKYGLHTRVFITREGIPTYEAKELGLCLEKTQRRTFDVSVTITAVEQEQYFNVVFKAFEVLRPEFVGKFLHAHHGMMVLPSGKMGSRKGNVITGESLIDDMIARAKEKVSERGVSDAEQIAQDVAVGAIKYMVLKQGLGKNITFDIEKSLSFEGDSGPYLQYTYTRANAVLEKARDNGIVPALNEQTETTDVVRLCERFAEVVRGALEKQYAPNDLVHYLIAVASAFNSWYAQEKIVDTDNMDVSAHRTAVTQAVASILSHGLSLLGIPTPSRM